MKKQVTAIIALGANLGDRRSTMELAITEIIRLVGPVADRSKFYETPPLVLPGVNAETVPSYLNAVIASETGLAAVAILHHLLEIERKLGRDRDREVSRWMSRVIDLDLIAVDEQVIHVPGLTIPHPEMHRRDFVLRPMFEVAPDWRHPLLKQTVAAMTAGLNGSAKDVRPVAN